MENTDNRIFGLRAIIEAIDSGKEIDKIYLHKENQGALARELQHKINKHKISFSYVPVEKLNRLSKFKNHQGAVATVGAVKFKELEPLLNDILSSKKAPILLLLDQISDVRNLGAILRTAECTGVDAVILPSHGSAPVNADAIKTSAGAAFKLNLCRVQQIADAIFVLQEKGIETIAVTEKTDTSIYDQNLKVPVALIMGSEHMGISKKVLKLADHKASLPLKGDIGSLNVSVAAGVVLYETVRQRL